MIMISIPKQRSIRKISKPEQIPIQTSRTIGIYKGKAKKTKQKLVRHSRKSSKVCQIWNSWFMVVSSTHGLSTKRCILFEKTTVTQCPLFFLVVVKPYDHTYFNEWSTKNHGQTVRWTECPPGGVAKSKCWFQLWKSLARGIWSQVQQPPKQAR